MSGFSQYMINKLHDFLHREQAFDPPATVYVALCYTQPTRSTAGTEVDDTTHPTYARVALTHSLANISGTQGATTTAASSGTSSQISNNALIDFGTAGTNWGSPTPVGYWETYDDPTAGNRLEFGTIVDGAGSPSPRSIVAGDPVQFPISSFKYGMS